MTKNAIHTRPSKPHSEGEMMSRMYLSFETLLDMIEEPNKTACRKLCRENWELLREAPGSTHNHQAWPGGYVDHELEIMNIAVVLYESLSSCRSLPFSLSDAILVLFVHDIEKPWMYTGQTSERFVPKDKADRHAFRKAKLSEYGIHLNAEQNNAFQYVEGEVDGTYSSSERRMNELASFCHMCDVASARLWHDRPRESGEVWGQRES